MDIHSGKPNSNSDDYDLIVVGGGTAGLALAAEVGKARLRTLVVEAIDHPGGTLEVSSGHLSAADTSIQRAKGIEDSIDEHFQDVMRISRGQASASLVRAAVELAPGIIEWLLDHDFDIDPDCPSLYYFHEAYSVPRTYWGIQGGRSILHSLERAVAPAVDAGLVEIWLNTRLVDIEVEGSRATAAIVEGGPEENRRKLPMRAIALCGGGHASNLSAIRELTVDQPVLSGAWRGADGSVLSVARKAGAAVWGQGVFMPTFGGIEEPPGSMRVDRGRIPMFVTQDRPTWEIFVDANGMRFVREDSPSADERELALRNLDPMYFWVVFDDRIKNNAPSLLSTWSPEEEAAAWVNHPHFVSAPTIFELAERIGADPRRLAETVEEYNTVVAAPGSDPLGREFAPVAIADPPFYAIKNHASLVKSFAGLQVTSTLRVQRQGSPAFSNVFAAGEILGGAAFAGDAFVGGMSLTPALAFGRWLGEEIIPRYLQSN